MMTGMEHSGIHWGTTRIPYLIRRSARRGTVSIAVEPSGQVILTAPQRTPVERLDRVVRQKARWIVERVRQGGGLSRPAEREFVSGETVLYLGRSYRLKVVQATGASPARLERGWLVVSIDPGLTAPERPRVVRAALVAWYRPRAEAQLRKRSEQWARRFHLPSLGVLVRDPRRRWGSCDSSGTLRFSWRIIQATPWLIEYVIAHELTHLRHEHHTPVFWAALGRVIPDYEARRAELKRIGAIFLW